MKKKKVLLVIMDGWGHNTNPLGNAILEAKKPNFDYLWEKYPHCFMKTDGESVGLPEGQFGTSEVNHMTMGAGRVLFQDLVRINKSIKDGDFEQNEAILKAMEHVKKNNSTLHIKGLLSDGGVHSHQTHFYGLLSLAKKLDVERVLVHIYTDGRDTAPKSAKKYITELEDFMQKLGLGRIASVSGRYYAMDRDNNEERIDLAFEVMTKGVGRKYKTAMEAIDEAYKSGETDEFILPTFITGKENERQGKKLGDEELLEQLEQVTGGEFGTIGSNDAIIFTNFRADRGVQITKKFLESDLKNLNFVTMAHYRDDLGVNVAFSPQSAENNLGEFLAKNGKKQLRVSETEKYNHVTFFFNCKKDKPFDGEDRILLNSNSDVKTHDEKPEMRAFDITEEITQALNQEKYDLIVTNYPNPDIIGHTTNFPATVKAVEIVDECLGKLTKEVLKHNYAMIITADHGNAEQLIHYETGEPMTSHTSNLVPLILVTDDEKVKIKTSDEIKMLSSIAPTILNLLEMSVPVEMDGENLIERN